jgi:hypothetical protein
MYKLDRNSFKQQSFQEAAVHAGTYKKLSVTERLRIAFYLISVAYQFNMNNPPRMDKTIFEKRRHNIL